VLHYSSTCKGVVSSAMEMTAVLVSLGPVLASWRVLCSNRSGFEGSGIVVDRPVFVCERARGSVDKGPYEVQRQTWWCPVPTRFNSAGVVAAVHGVALQGRGWPHRVDSDGDDAPAGLTSRFDPVYSRKKGFKGSTGPLRGPGMSAVPDWAAQCRRADTGLVAQCPTPAGMGSP
jgi:hypothetical protein